MSRNDAFFAVLALALDVLPSPNELARTDRRKVNDEKPRSPQRTYDPEIAKRYRVERLSRKAAAFRKRNHEQH